MATIFDCSGSSCVEAGVESAIAIVGTFFFLRAFRVIIKDRNNILNRITKIIFGFALSQMILLTLYFLIWGISIEIIYIFRVRFSHLLDKVPEHRDGNFDLQHPIRDRVRGGALQYDLKNPEAHPGRGFCRVVLDGSCKLKFLRVIFKKKKLFLHSYLCYEMDYVLLSATALILSLIAAYLGISAL